MPWKEQSVMDERIKFVGRLLSGEKMGIPELRNLRFMFFGAGFYGIIEYFVAFYILGIRPC